MDNQEDKDYDNREKHLEHEGLTPESPEEPLPHADPCTDICMLIDVMWDSSQEKVAVYHCISWSSGERYLGQWLLQSSEDAPLIREVDGIDALPEDLKPT